MRWGSALSRNPSTSEALAEVVAEAGARCGEPSLAVLFATTHHQHRFDALPSWVVDALPGVVVFGCSATGVIGAGREAEDACALSLTLAELPGVRIHPFYLESGAVPSDWAALIGASAGDDPQLLVLADPFGFDPDLLGGLDASFPAAPKLGGLASGITGPGEAALFLGTTRYRTGLVGVSLCGDVVVEPVVAQGCRPIGAPMFATGVHGNVLTELDGAAPLPQLVALYESLGPEDQALFQHSLFLGVQMREQAEYAAGDFLIRNVTGVDPERGWLAVGAHLNRFDVVQFHLRDAATSAGDLRARLPGRRGDVAGGLLFSCTGRGRHLYGRPDHDTDLFREHVGAVPLGGCFCAGEIGPVQGRTWLHGYTSSFGLFRPR